MSAFTNPLLAELALLRSVLEGYLEAAYYTAAKKGLPWDMPLAPEAAAQATQDCCDFITDYRAELDQCLASKALSPINFGEDLWLTRNRLGGGFYETAMPMDWRLCLQGAAYTLGSVDLVQGEDGLARFN